MGRDGPMSVTTTRPEAELHRHGPPLARAGWLAKGAVFVIMGVLALQVAFGESARPDPHGALEAVAGQGAGKALLLALAIGLTLYCLGRILEATVFAGPHEEASDRLRSVGSALVYGLIALTAWSQALGGGSAGSAQGSDPRR